MLQVKQIFKIFMQNFPYLDSLAIWFIYMLFSKLPYLFVIILLFHQFFIDYQWTRKAFLPSSIKFYHEYCRVKMWSWVTLFSLFLEKTFIFFCSSTFCKLKQFFCLEFHFAIKIKVIRNFVRFLLLIFWNFFIHICYVNLAFLWVSYF